MAIVGESGCGKSTTLLEIMEFVKPQQGSIKINGVEPYSLSRAEQRKLRAHIQIVFQDPMGSLDPRMPVGEIIAEPLKIADGFALCPDRPGHGITFDWTGLESIRGDAG